MPHFSRNGALVQEGKGDTKIAVHLSRMLGFESAALEVDHDVTVQVEVVKQQIDVEVVVVDLDVDLTSDKGKTGA